MGNKNSSIRSKTFKAMEELEKLEETYPTIPTKPSILPPVEELRELNEKHFVQQENELEEFIDKLTNDLIAAINRSVEKIRCDAKNGKSSHSYKFDKEKLKHDGASSTVILDSVVKKIIKTGYYDGYKFKVLTKCRSDNSRFHGRYIAMSW
jgi:hypothetical protein